MDTIHIRFVSFGGNKERGHGGQSGDSGENGAVGHRLLPAGVTEGVAEKAWDKGTGRGAQDVVPKDKHAGGCGPDRNGDKVLNGSE